MRAVTSGAMGGLAAAAAATARAGAASGCGAAAARAGASARAASTAAGVGGADGLGKLLRSSTTGQRATIFGAYGFVGRYVTALMGASIGVAGLCGRWRSDCAVRCRDGCARQRACRGGDS